MINTAQNPIRSKMRQRAKDGRDILAASRESRKKSGELIRARIKHEREVREILTAGRKRQR